MHILLIDMTGPSILLIRMKSVDRAAQPPRADGRDDDTDNLGNFPARAGY
jgi:hypothetical protein